MDVWRIEHTMAHLHRSGQAGWTSRTFLSYHRGWRLTRGSQLWGFKSEGGLDHYAHVLNQHKLLVVR